MPLADLDGAPRFCDIVRMKPEQCLDAIFRADRELREAEGNLFASAKDKALAEVLSNAVNTAAAHKNRAEAAMRLERLADLCAQVEGPLMVDALFRILDDDEPAVRVAAGEALLDVAFDRYAEVARTMEVWLDRKHDGPAMSELPWILSEIAEPSALPLLKRFLAHKEAEVVASAIEAIAALGDPDGIPALEAFAKDEREIEVDDGETESKATIAELVEDAIRELGGGEDA